MIMMKVRYPDALNIFQYIFSNPWTKFPLNLTHEPFRRIENNEAKFRVNQVARIVLIHTNKFC